METFCNIIKKAREKKKLLIRQAAAMLDIDPSLLSKYENGDRRPTRELIEKMSIIYELDKNEILTEWLSDKIVYVISSEENAIEILKVAEEKINFNNSVEGI
jgi:transcriptional regulator with XRE-family HTH domain